ncbi:MAG TPA: M20/M25/M40 family metallo-hydrolase [Actinomycetota bacterium]|jgi:acetylornithine deacetylase/succinyl-diaminopimelate desuccinylase-like protein|nr:M20/M25/M40 family metallo-hydrolase [Actinomycetota bacterium]
MKAIGATLVDQVVDRTITLASVPAPTGEEAARAELVALWWRADSFDDVHGDPAGNVWARVRSGAGAAVVLAAHLDTVFGRDVAHEIARDGDTLRGPGVGDDAVGVAGIGAAAAGIGPDGPPVWLCATVGEEGLGNLAGVTAALDAPPIEVGALLAVEGNYLGRVSTVGVGSARRRVRIGGPGGHAWEAADAPSAVHQAASLIATIVATRRAPGTAVNVGRVGGGEGINVRARDAWFEVDLRADDPAALADLVRSVESTVATTPAPLEVRLEAIGDRPAGRVDPGAPLVRAAEAALIAEGVTVTNPATSTDANAAHARGIPAVAVGITTGAGEHTTGEWIDIAPIASGVRALAATVDRYGKARR